MNPRLFAEYSFKIKYCCRELLLGVILRVLDFTDRFYPVIKSGELITKARALMRDIGLRFLPVVEERRLLGVITRQQVLLISSTRSQALVKEVMETPSLVFNSDELASKALSAMIEFDEWYAPVVTAGGSKYVGVISLDEFMRFIIKHKYPEHELPVERVMSSKVITVTPEDSIVKLWKKMLMHKFSGFPVVEGRRKVIKGIITQHDLLRKGYGRIELESPSGPKKGPKVRELMTTPPLTLRPDSKLIEAVMIMVKSDIGRIPIVNDRKELLGIVDRSDVCKPYVKYA